MKEAEALRVVDGFIKQEIEWAKTNWPTEVEKRGVESVSYTHLRAHETG